MLSKLIEKQLIFSMKMDKSRWKIMRILGKLTGIFPVWYAKQLEKQFGSDLEQFEMGCKEKEED